MTLASPGLFGHVIDLPKLADAKLRLTPAGSNNPYIEFSDIVSKKVKAGDYLVGLGAFANSTLANFGWGKSFVASSSVNGVDSTLFVRIEGEAANEFNLEYGAATWGWLNSTGVSTAANEKMLGLVFRNTRLIRGSFVGNKVNATTYTRDASILGDADRKGWLVAFMISLTARTVVTPPAGSQLLYQSIGSAPSIHIYAKEVERDDPLDVSITMNATGWGVLFSTFFSAE